MRRKLAAGNWKMNGLTADLNDLADLSHDGVDVLVCPPATLIAQARYAARGTSLLLGGQDCHAAAAGAHTGDISAAMLRDAGATHVILGHSERRSDHDETSDMVRAKTDAAVAAGLIAVICVGETLAERDADTTMDVLTDQLSASVPPDATGATIVVAYEPVWAIGTGRTATAEQIAQAHAHIRAVLKDHLGDEAAAVRLLYGGSVKAGNAAEIFAVPEVDGALVGGASLTAAAFRPIIEALAAAPDSLG